MEFQSVNDLFKQLYTRLMQLSSKESDKSEVLVVTTKLNSLNYKDKLPFITTWTCTDLFLHVIDMLKEFGHEDVYIIQICQLIINVAAKQKIVVCSMSVNVILHGLKDIWLQMFANQTSLHFAIAQELYCHFLGAVSAITYGNGAYILPELLEWLVGKQGKNGNIGALLVSPVSVEIKKACLQCLSGLCMMSESRENLNEEYMHCCLQLFIQALQTTPSIKDVVHYRVIFAAHRGLQYILDGPSGIHVEEIGPLLAILKKHLVFGLSTASSDLPFVLEPIPIPEAMHSKSQNSSQIYESHHSVKKKKKRNRRRQQATQEINPKDSRNKHDTKGNNNPPIPPSDLKLAEKSRFVSEDNSLNFSALKLQVASSESEYSDTEGGQLSALTSFALKIRQMAIGSLYSIVKKTSKLTMLGYWNSFISGSSAHNDISVLSCIVNDPSPKARVAALMVLYAMLDGSRTFLSLAIQKGVSSSFISFSDMLTSSVHDIHQTLLTALAKEPSSFVQVHILKAMSSLSANAPYAKLKKGLIATLITKAKLVLTSSRELDCRIAAINVFISLLGNESAVDEVASAILHKEVSSHADDLQNGENVVAASISADSISRCWLIEDSIKLCLQHNDSSDRAQPVRVAALQLIATSLKLHFSVIKQYLHQLTSVISNCMRDSNPTVRLYASKLLEEIGRNLLLHQKNDSGLLAQSQKLWQELLSGPVQIVVRDTEDVVNRSHVCDFLGTIGPEVFENLPQKLQVFCQTLLLGFTNDEYYLVRSVSIRALAVYIMYPVLRKDICFVEDVAGCILRLMKDPVKSVQSNAAWSFGNFTDAIIINVENESESFSRSNLGTSLLMELIGSAIKTFGSTDKVRYNMMRVLGNMLRFFNKSHVNNDKICSVILQAKAVIVNAIEKDPLMKVRWNACLACGNMLQNSHLPCGRPEWTDDVYAVLCSAVLSSKNYKVRIKAAIALGCPKDRESFGTHFTNIYTCVLNSLMNSEVNEVDFGEYKFKDKLQEQLLCTLFILTSYVTVKDIPIITEVLLSKTMLDFIKSQISRWYNLLHCEHHSVNQMTIGNEGYAALGIFTSDQRKSMFEKAMKQWENTIALFSNSDLLEKCTITKEDITICSSLFSLS